MIAMLQPTNPDLCDCTRTKLVDFLRTCGVLAPASEWSPRLEQLSHAWYRPALWGPEPTDVSAHRLRALAQRREYQGTSFVLHFDPLTNVHQHQPNMEVVHPRIACALRQRCVAVLVQQLEDRHHGAVPKQSLQEGMEMRICPTSQDGHHNGEVYCWLPGIPLRRSFAFAVLAALEESLSTTPLTIQIDDAECIVPFYGYGIRYI